MTDRLRKYVFPNLPYALIGWVCLKLGTAYRMASGANIGYKLMAMMNTISPAFGTIAPGTVFSDWLIGLAGAVIIRVIILQRAKNAKKYRKDREYGSARWSA